MDEKFLKPYDPLATEDRIYTLWEESGYFNPDNLPGERAESFSVVLPPPNVTGVLHIGHAYEDSIQDAVVRYNRMQGKKTLWIPGTDSAALPTQARVEKNIQKEEGKSRHDLGRDELVRRVIAFAKASENTILSQVRKVGASLDWSRYAYTMDEKRNRAVTEAFIRMYDAGLIYKGHRVINWDPKGQTTISDDEVVYVEQKDPFYYFQYGPFVIGTVRPETKFGDKYVVINPTDERYKEYSHGQQIELEWINGPITATVLHDPEHDMEFGSGVMTITPWHDAHDFELAERFKLDKEQVIDKYGKLLPIAGEFAGMKITDARPQIVEKLKQKGLVVKEDTTYVHNVATSERTGALIEPQVMEQWFVAVDKPVTFPTGETMTLKEWMLRAVESGAVDMPQEGFRKSYFNWITHLHDWNISRQIWFGHRIPIWYKDGETRCGGASPGDGWLQEEDVLDTWFSSALWTFSTLGWPDNTDDLARFHPTSFMSPAYEILYLWVSRMILMAGFHLGQPPFTKVMIHGLVRDRQGRKFSKSLNNGIDPLDVIAKYGADALRMGLTVGAPIGNDIKFDEMKVKGYRNFANKLWNITRYVLENVDSTDLKTAHTLTKEDEEDLAELNRAVLDVTRNLEEYRIDLAADRAYHYVWHTFADDVIERSKTVLRGTDAVAARATAWKLYTILTTSLKLLHPFMPFVTEEIWQSLPERDTELLMVAPWPQSVTIQ